MCTRVTNSERKTVFTSTRKNSGPWRVSRVGSECPEASFSKMNLIIIAKIVTGNKRLMAIFMHRLVTQKVLYKKSQSQLKCGFMK